MGVMCCFLTLLVLHTAYIHEVHKESVEVTLWQTQLVFVFLGSIIDGSMGHNLLMHTTNERKMK